MVRFFFIAVLGFLSLSLTFGEARSSVDLRLLGLFGRGADETVVYLNSAQGRVSFESDGNKDVKAQVALDAWAFNDVSYLSLSRAWIKSRLNFGRLQMGKTRTTWGAGVMYNAGDVVFGGDEVDLTAAELRDQTRWMTALYLPLGDFSFLELILIAPDIIPSLIAYSTNNPAEADPLFKTAQLGGSVPLMLPVETKSLQGGLRAQWDLGGFITLEGAYIYKGEAEDAGGGIPAKHVPSLSFQTALWDWDVYGAGNVSFIQTNPEWDRNKDSLQFSLGSFYTKKIAYLYDLSLRLEASIQPYVGWDVPEGFLLYSDINLSPGQGETYFLRGIFSPIDQSGEATLGAVYPIAQSLNFLSFVQGRFGENSDLYQWSGPGGWSVTWGLNYQY